MTYSETELVTILMKASDAYYNNKTEGLLTDDEYDTYRDELEMRFPQNPYLKQIGAPVEKGSTKLPYKMASLNKIKPGTGAVGSFVEASKNKQWVLSDKLDGISVLWDTGSRKLYLRGDGFMGVDVSAFAPHITGLSPKGFQQKWFLRGELVLPNGIDVDATLPRSWVNGQLHQKKPIPENLKKIRFVAYELVEPSSLTREVQLQTMQTAGFEVPIYCLVNTLNDDMLSSYLQQRREKSSYAIDGIVVGENSIPVKDTSQEVTNPKDMRAFKMPMADQKATTKIVDIVWSASYQGYWIPRIQIEPVVIGGSRIEFLTGHNARFVITNSLGKGAVIIVRKSGDVIPTLESVVVSGDPVTLPEGVWDGDPQTASHYKVNTGVVNTEIQQKQLEHFAKTLDIPHLGPGLVAKLVAGKKVSPNDLLTISKEDLESLVGKGMATKIYPVIQEKKQSCTEMDLMIGSSLMPRGVGDSKLKAVFQINADPRKWSSITSCEGWSKEALASFLTNLSTYEVWRKNQLSCIPYPKITTWSAPGPTGPTLAFGVDVEPIRGTICLTGFRDAVFQKQMEAKGFVFAAGVSKKVTHLIVKDLQDTSEKVKKAMELGIRILTREDAMQEYLG